MSMKRTPGTLVVNLRQGYFGLCCGTSLKVKVGNIGPWSTKSPSFRRRHRPYAVRQGRSDRAILPAHGPAGRALVTCSVRPADQPPQYQRIAESSAVSAGAGPRPNRDHRTAALRRRLPLFGGVAGLSGRGHLAAVPRAAGSRRTQRLFFVRAQLVRPGGVLTLRLAPSYAYVADFLGTLRRIRRLRSPF